MSDDAAEPPRAPAAQAPGDGFDQERLRVLVNYSGGLRLQMLSAAAVMAAVVVMGGHSPWTALTWLGLTVLVREGRAARLRHIVDNHAAPIAARLREVHWTTFALGLAYGSSAVFMLDMDVAVDAILTMILLSLSAGAINTTFTVLPAFVYFGGAIAVPAAAAWALTGGWAGAAVALLILMFYGVQVRFARQTLRMFDESYRMRQANTGLMEQLTEQRARLASARDAAVAADLAKSRFLAAASHDLRQPLQSLALNSGALARLPLEGSAREIAAEMAQGIDSLRRMLDGLLDMSQLDAGAVMPVLQPVMLDRLLQGLGQRFERQAQAKGLELAIDCPSGSVVTSDPQLLLRVMSNLMDNAVKFTAAGTVRVSARPDGARVRVTVADTGCGMQPADLPRIFEDLGQLGNPQRDRGQGHGLGLGIVRRLCRLLGIEVSVQSQPGEGTQVSLDLPAATAGGLAVLAEPGASTPALVARRVLVLDDDPEVRSAYGRALQALGCDVRVHGTVEDAARELPTWRPEVALIDYRIAEDLTGLDAIARLRAQDPGLDAILVSADTTPELRRAASAAGVPMLRKPVTEATLAQAINTLLSERRRDVRTAAPGSTDDARP